MGVGKVLRWKVEVVVGFVEGLWEERGWGGCCVFLLVEERVGLLLTLGDGDGILRECCLVDLEFWFFYDVRLFLGGLFLGNSDDCVCRVEAVYMSKYFILFY